MESREKYVTNEFVLNQPLNITQRYHASIGNKCGIHLSSNKLLRIQKWVGYSINECKSMQK